MGYYINPPDMTKEQWLGHHARELRTPAEAQEVGGDEMPVVLMDNGPFTAAGIAYCDNELAAFAEPDGRPKRFFAAPKAKLLEVCPQLEQVLNVPKDTVTRPLYAEAVAAFNDPEQRPEGAQSIVLEAEAPAVVDEAPAVVDETPPPVEPEDEIPY